MDFKKVYDKAMELTVEQGLSKDKELTKDSGLMEKLEMETNYRLLGSLFAINLFDNLVETIEKEDNEEKGN